MRIAVLDDYQDAFRTLSCYRRLAGHDVTVFRDTIHDAAKLAARLQGMDAVVLTQQRTAFPRAVIDKLSTLRFIAQTGKNTSHIDLSACTEHGIAVAVGGGGGTPYATVELTWALILASVRHITEEVARLQQGVWQTTLGAGLHGKTLGVYGFGSIGSRVAAIGRAFGMRVVCFGRDGGSLTNARASGFDVAVSREAFFTEADVLTLHLALNDATHGIVSAGDLNLMKPSALLVNTSRALLIAEGALAAALERGRPGYAAVDVYESEPVVGGAHPLLRMRNALCTPHLGYVEAASYEQLYGAVTDRLLAFAAGAPVALVNELPAR